MINTYSAFVYGHTITDDNKFINFDEGGSELTAEIDVGSYTLDAFVNAIALALNSASGSTLEYTVAVDRSTRLISISSTSNFTLLIATGTQASSSAFSLMGFGGADLSGADNYTGNIASGSYFEPQFMLQKYVDFIDNVKTTQASVNQTASGSVEVVSYGTVKFMECNITLQTNISQGKGSMLKDDPTGYDKLRAFLSYGITKAPMEFIPNILDQNTYTDCILESTPQSRDGVDFKVTELYSKGFAEYYESGLLTFRQLQ